MDETDNNTSADNAEIEANAAVEAQEPDTDGSESGGGFVPDDSLLERAVKAGMSLGDAKSFSSRDMAERFIGMLEGRAAKAGDGAQAGAGGDEFPAIDFGDLTEENGYEPNIVKAFNLCKATIEAQAKVIKELKAGYTAKGREKAVDTRRNLVLARPGGERGRVSGKTDAEADAVAALRRRFKLN